LVLAVGLASAATYHEEIAVSSGGKLNVNLESGGAITITVWDRDVLSVDADFRGRDADNVRFEVRGDGDTVRVTSEFVERRKRSGSDGEVKIQLPRRFDLRLYTNGGTIEIDGVEGLIEGQTMGGDLKLSGLRGTLNLETYGGEVRLSGSKVDGALKTYGGNMSLTDVVGPVEATTMGGNVVLDNVDGGRVGEGHGEVRISTMGGNISVPDAPFGADLETMGGNIVVERAADHVQASTMGGNVRVESLDGWARVSTMGGNIEVQVTGSGGDVRLSSEGGDITLRVPDGFSMDVDITIESTRQGRQDVEVISDFELQTTDPGGWDYSSKPPRRYVRARGSVAGGANKVKIETTDGDVRLLRAR
jgi:DUF4097 and DUF4098 domain-containing protein YvlB